MYVHEIAQAWERIVAVDDFTADGDATEANDFFDALELEPARRRWFNIPDRAPDAISKTAILGDYDWWELEDGTVLGRCRDESIGGRWIIPPGLEVPRVKDYQAIELQGSTVPREVRHRVGEEVERNQEKIERGFEIADLRPLFLCGLEIGYRLGRGESVDIGHAVRECAARMVNPKSPIAIYEDGLNPQC